jgi:hypothetical protein
MVDFAAAPARPKTGVRQPAAEQSIWLLMISLKMISLDHPLFNPLE